MKFSRAIAIVAALLCLLGAGCSGRTQILVWVWSDIGTAGPMGMTRINVHITSPGAPVFDRTFTLNHDDGMGHITRVPGVVVVAYPHDNNSASPVTVDVMPMWGTAAAGAGGNLYAQPSHHVATFRPGHTDLMPVYLPMSCAGMSVPSCPLSTQTCSLSGCERDDPPLTDFTGTYPLPFGSGDSGPSLFCDGGLTNCSGTCVDLTTSAAHCGTCSVSCDPQAACVGGMCNCTAGLMNCDGGCIDPQTDMQHCGACSTPCFAPGVCTHGGCYCGPGLVNCAGHCVDVNANCGRCGNNCLFGTCVNDLCHCGAATCAAGVICCSSGSCCP